MTQKTEQLLEERSKTHGSFEDNAEISQMLKNYFRLHSKGYGDLGLPQREALDMIALKLSRILSGHADFKDHWDDIAGYARLVSESLEK